MRGSIGSGHADMSFFSDCRFVIQCDRKGNADLLITGDLKYHEALDAKEEGMYILDVGHYESEHFFNILIGKILAELSGVEYFIYNDEPVLKRI